MLPTTPRPPVAPPPTAIAKTGLNTDVLQNWPGYVLRRAQLHVTHELCTVLTPHGLRPGSYATLLLVQANPGSSPSDLADTLRIARANFATLLDRLLADDFISRIPRTDDRRFRAVHITPSGAAVLHQVAPKVAQHEARVRAALAPPGTDTVARLYAWLSDPTALNKG